MKIRSRLLSRGALLILLVPAAAHAEPHCVVMKFFDAQGVAIPMAQPVIAMMVGRKPAINGTVPNAASREPGAEVPCPDSLVADVQKLFEQSCLTEQRRNQAAVDRKVARSVIDKGCADMTGALGDRIKPTP